MKPFGSMASFSSSTSRARLSLEELYKLVILIQASIMIQEGSSKNLKNFPFFTIAMQPPSIESRSKFAAFGRALSDKVTRYFVISKLGICAHYKQNKFLTHTLFIGKHSWEVNVSFEPGLGR